MNFGSNSSVRPSLKPLTFNTTVRLCQPRRDR
jgi:hypothetical protein